MSNKFFNDAVIGNKNVRATFSSTGELLRAYYPSVDFKQFVDFFHVGMKVNDSAIIYLHQDINKSSLFLNTSVADIASGLST